MKENNIWICTRKICISVAIILILIVLVSGCGVSYKRMECLAFSEENKTEEALECYNKLIASGVKDEFIYSLKGALLLSLNRTEESLASYNQALELKSDDKSALLGIGVGLFDAKKYEEAIDYFDRALLINQTDIDSLKWKGLTLLTLGIDLIKAEKYEEALDYFDKALLINPTDIMSLKWKGLTLINLKREQEALFYYDKVLEIDPRDKDVLAFKRIFYFKDVECKLILKDTIMKGETKVYAVNPEEPQNIMDWKEMVDISLEPLDFMGDDKVKFLVNDELTTEWIEINKSFDLKYSLKIVPTEMMTSEAINESIVEFVLVVC